MSTRGYIDKMEGCYIVGWAASSEAGKSTITITDDQNNLLAKGRASSYRHDLSQLNLEHPAFGFKIPLPLSTTHQNLHILANGTELPGSPLRIGPGLFDASCTIEEDHLTGWVSERVRTQTAPYITVINQFGQEVARGASHLNKKAEDPFFAPARFRLTLDIDCFGAGEMQLKVYANGVFIAALSCTIELRSSLEVISDEQVRGWLYSPNAPHRQLNLCVYRNGKLAETNACALERTDVRDHFPDCGHPGFDIRLPDANKTEDEWVRLSIRLEGGTRELFDSPYLLARRATAVSSLYKAGYLTHHDLPGLALEERALLESAITAYLATLRSQTHVLLSKQALSSQLPSTPYRMAIIIPIYRDVRVTQACIESVLAHRDPHRDLLLLINDRSPDADMAPMLEQYANTPDVHILTNNENLGFIGTVNRGMTFANGLDTLLLNSDTCLFAGGLDELAAIAHAEADIGTVTAMSNNATIFSYPGMEIRKATLPDLSWSALAALALQENRGIYTDIPTGHGFCMLIKADVVKRVGLLNTAFGRGYGEENDFCARTAALGYRNVVAGGVIVEHKESISFGNERASLMAMNQPILNQLYPEYSARIMAFEKQDGLRQVRWALDRARLARARTSGTKFALVISNGLEGGTPKAIREIEHEVGYHDAIRLSLSVTKTGLIELSCQTPLLCAYFNETEASELISMLNQADPQLVLAHQLLGFSALVISALADWLQERHSLYWAHDFYTFCPRVTMIDAIGRFCAGADANTCARCVEMGGSHEASTLTDLTPEEHRDLFGRLLSKFSHIIAPSNNAAGYLRKIFPSLQIDILPHPEPAVGVAKEARDGNNDEIVMLGAIGPHKGSHTLLEIARQARLTHPHLHFRVIGYTNIDKDLKAVGNVTITGKYKPKELPELLAATKGRLGLFLPAWPETYSYTLSELVKYGFIPLAPDIGAPADRIRAAGFGAIFPFPAVPEAILKLIDDIQAKKIIPMTKDAQPANFFSRPDDLKKLRETILPATNTLKTEAPP